MKRVFTTFLVAISLALVLPSCQKAPELTITGPASLEISADGGSNSITFTANREWSVRSSDLWVSVTPSSGAASDGTVTLSIRCNENTTYEDRSATITITMEELSQTVTVKQPANLGIVIPTQSFNLASDARSIEVEVQANVQYSVSVSENWIKQTGTKALATDKLTFSIDENTTYDSRSATITIRPQNAAVQEQAISVTQSANEGVLAVDLGLSVKWASVNLGASKPWEYGDYYAWGETEPYYSSLDPLAWKENTGYNWDSYKWAYGAPDKLNKYCDNIDFWGNSGKPDYKDTLDPEDDAAHMRLGGDWRMPAKHELEELMYCQWTITTYKGIAGAIVTNDTNSNSIFIPFSGYWRDETLTDVGAIVYLWGNGIYTHRPNRAAVLGFTNNNDGAFRTYEQLRYYGFPIRPVKE